MNRTDGKLNSRLKAILMLVVMLVSVATVSVSSDMTAYAATPTEPTLSSAAAVVINADTGEVLFSKDGDSKYYPASITKVMTALLVMENCPDLDAMVTFSKTATTNLESGAVTIKLTEGDKLSVRDCLYALMLKSANEVANGLAEHVGGSISGFADMMNKRAAQLGCTNTHFVNPNGLNNADHYVSAHDMALIAAEAFKNETLRKIDTTTSYQLPATINSPKGTLLFLNNKILMKGHEKYYEYAKAGKTGYTKKAGNTLATYAEKDGVHLVAVTLKNTKYLAHYDDTKALLEYGFAVMEERKNSEGENETTVEQTAETQTVTQTPAAEINAGAGESTGTDANTNTNTNANTNANTNTEGESSELGKVVELIGPGADN